MEVNILPAKGVAALGDSLSSLLGRLRSWANASGGSPGVLADRLDACACALGARAAETEPDFVALGGDLRSLYEAATGLAQAIDETTARLHAVLTGNRFAGTDGLVAATLDAVHAGVRGVDHEVNQLATMMTGLAAMDPQLARIQRMCLFLQSTAVGFAVESSRTPACQLAFGSFVDEIRGLARRIATVERKVGDELTEARLEETARVDELRGGLGAMRELATQLERTSATAAAEVQGGVERIAALIAGTRERSQLLRQQAEGAVYHVQFGDITRQKNEHIVAALQAVAETLRRARKRSQVRVAALAADQTLAIQIGQMEVVCDELEAARNQLADAFAQIAATAAAFVAPLRDRGAGETGAKFQPQGVLTADFDQLLSLDGKSRDLRGRAADTAEHAFATAERLGVQMQEVQSINRDMHLLALNATVKTAALGDDGATLEVLSRQIHELYREADSAVTEVVALATRLRQRDPHATETAASVQADGGARHRLEDGVQQVRQAFTDFDRLAAAALERAGQQDSWLVAAAAKLGALQRFAEQLRGLAGDLQQIRTALAPLCGPRKGDAAAAQIDVEHHYTMQAERDIHRRIMAERAPPVATERMQGRVRAEDSAGRIAPAATTAIEFFSDPPDAAAPTPPSAEGEPAAKSLGDNVELF